MDMRSSCGPIAGWILAWTSSLATWSLYEMRSILRYHHYYTQPAIVRRHDSEQFFLCMHTRMSTFHAYPNVNTAFLVQSITFFLWVTETQTALVLSCFPFIRSGQNHLARHSERGKKTRQTEEEVGRQHQGMDRPGIWQVPEGSGEQRKMEKTGCKIICGAPTTLAVKGLIMMMMTMYLFFNRI